jgi:hypothetical protein
MSTKTTLDTLYLINNTRRNVSLELNIGAQGQKSLTTVRLNNNVVVENLDGDLLKTKIGLNADLKGKILKIVCTITDTSRITNLTFLNIKITGGVLTRSYPLYKTVDSEGESVDYYCFIEFYKP